MADYGDEQDDATAMLELLYAQTDVTTYPAEDGGPSTVPTNALPPYRSVHFATEHTAEGGSMTHLSTRTITRAFVHCVGANDIAARAMVRKTKEAWLDVRLDLPGRNAVRIKHEQTRDAQPTEPVAKTTVTITTIYRLEHVPGVDGS